MKYLVLVLKSKTFYINLFLSIFKLKYFLYFILENSSLFIKRNYHFLKNTHKHFDLFLFFITVLAVRNKNKVI